MGLLNCGRLPNFENGLPVLTDLVMLTVQALTLRAWTVQVIKCGHWLDFDRAVSVKVEEQCTCHCTC